MQRSLKRLEEESLAELRAAQGEAQVHAVRTKYLGRKGLLTQLSSGNGEASARRTPGSRADSQSGESRIGRSGRTGLEKERVQTENRRLLQERSGLSAYPGRKPLRGSKHLITQVNEEIVSIFERLGFEVSEGPEVELDYYNFEALNFPKDHPARDMQDTFYISPNVVLRTHTSPVQVRTMESRKPPLRVIAPGRVYRHDSDPTHSPMFHQVEGFIVDHQITFADLKGTLTFFVQQFFGPDVQMRFRPSFFPFTEPSAEVDIQCVICQGQGCPVCKKSGWLEILGSGMIDPEVFGFVGYDPEVYTGFAFGLGVERIAMLQVGLNDIRILFENNLQFLKQF